MRRQVVICRTGRRFWAFWFLDVFSPHGLEKLVVAQLKGGASMACSPDCMQTVVGNRKNEQENFLNYTCKRALSPI